MIGLILGLFMGFSDPGVTFANRVSPEMWSAPLHSPLEYHPLPRVHSDPPLRGFVMGKGMIEGHCTVISMRSKCTWERGRV